MPEGPERAFFLAAEISLPYTNAMVLNSLPHALHLLPRAQVGASAGEKEEENSDAFHGFQRSLSKLYELFIF